MGNFKSSPLELILEGWRANRKLQKNPLIYLQLQTGPTNERRPLYLRKVAFVIIGSPARTRTTDKVINSHLLYRLSYWGMKNASPSVLRSESVYTTASKSVSSFLSSFFQDRKSKKFIRLFRQLPTCPALTQKTRNYALRLEAKKRPGESKITESNVPEQSSREKACTCFRLAAETGQTSR